MKHPKHPGIYAIRHIDSNWAYIGSSREIYRRWRSHKSDLRRGVHPCPHLQNAWRKHGEAVFKFEALEACFDDPVILMSLEQNWLDRCTTKLYNASSFAEPNTGRKMSEENRKKNSERMMGNKCGANSHNQGVLTESDIKVILYRYASGYPCRDIAAEFGVSTTNIHRIAKRTIWKHVPIPEDVDAARLERTKAKTRDARSHARRKVPFEDAERMREMRNAGVNPGIIAEQFGVSPRYLRSVVAGEGPSKPRQIIDWLTKPEIAKAVETKPLKKGYRVRKPREPRPKMPRVILQCGNCGIEFSRPQCHMKRASSRYYCSVPCRNARASERITDVMKSPETRAKLAKAQTGKKHSEETRAKMSAAHLLRSERNRQDKARGAI